MVKCSHLIKKRARGRLKFNYIHICKFLFWEHIVHNLIKHHVCIVYYILNYLIWSLVTFVVDLYKLDHFRIIIFLNKVCHHCVHVCLDVWIILCISGFNPGGGGCRGANAPSRIPVAPLPQAYDTITKHIIKFSLHSIISYSTT